MSTRLAGESEDPVRILQFTDTHLYSSPDGTLLNMNTQQSFDATLALARSKHWPPDRILATGDLVHDGSEAGYQRLLAQLETLDAPVNCIPGNHDEKDRLKQLLRSQRVSSNPMIRLQHWALLLVDSTIKDDTGGHLHPRALQLLGEQLQQNTDRHVMICLHHQVVPVGSIWLDTMTVDNADQLFELLAGYDNVKAILSGHVHQEVDRMHGRFRLLTTPSTCIQFMPGSESFALDKLNPGYRWINLFADGRIETGVERVPGEILDADMQSSGYA